MCFSYKAWWVGDPNEEPPYMRACLPDEGIWSISQLQQHFTQKRGSADSGALFFDMLLLLLCLLMLVYGFLSLLLLLFLLLLQRVLLYPSL